MLAARVLRRVHRSTGTVMTALFVMWFASGLVMMFVSFPRLSRAERAALTETIVADDIAIPPALRGRALPSATRVRIAMAQGAPIFTVIDDGRLDTYAARRVDAAHVAREASRRAGARVHDVERLTTADQWTVPSASSARLPLYRVALDDDAGTELYFAEDSGDLVQKTTRRDRLLAWLGPIPHWIYPTMLRRHRGAWRSVVLALVAVGLVVATSGLVSGLRVRAKRVRTIRDPWLRAHQALGLVVALPMLGWLASGAFSLSPFGRFGGPSPGTSLLRAVHGPRLVLPSDAALGDALRLCARTLDVTEVELFTFDERPHALCDDGAHEVMVGLEGRAHILRSLPLARALSRIAAIAPISDVARDVVEDELVYANHHDGDAPTPFVRITLDDRPHTTVYLDARRGRVIAAHTDETRLDRWLYQGLHRWDPSWLRRRPRLRYTLVGASMLAGVGLAALGLSMAARRGSRARRSARRRLSPKGGKPRRV